MARSNVKAIRDDVKARLIAADTVAEARVYVERVLPLSPDELTISPDDVTAGPVISFYTPVERHERVGPSPTYKTTLTCRVDCAATASDEETLAALLDALIAQIEGALFASSFRDQFDRLDGIETRSGGGTSQMEDGSRLFALSQTTFVCEYMSQFVPVESRPTFASAHIDFDFDTDGDIDVESVVPEA